MTGSGAAQRSAPDLAAILRLLRREGEGLLAPGTIADLAAGAERLEHARCNVVVLGAFKRGKSTLLNALLECDVLPTGVLPLTSATTIVQHGDRERLLVHFADEHTEEHPLAALREFATEPRNPGNGRGVALVEVELRNPLLSGGVQLVDTPGIASVHRHNTRAAYDVLGRVDAALCVMSADQPLAEQEVDLYRAAAQRAGRMLYVLTKSDQLSPEEREQAVAFVGRTLYEHGIADAKPDVLAVSATDRRGIAGLRDHLQALSAGTRELVVATSVARTAHAAAGELAQRCELEELALNLPLDELGRRAAALDERLAELEAAHADANDLMNRRVARFLDEHVNAPLLTYARDHDESLRRALHARASELDDRSPRALAAELDQWVDETVHARFAALALELRGVVADGLADVAAGHARRIERLLGEVQRAAADALGASGPGELPRVALAESGGFTFKLHDPEHALELIVGTARRVVPGPLGRRLVMSDAAQRLRAMTDRHAGRLRGELVARAKQAAADYCRRLDAAMSQTCEAVRAAIDQARQERARGGDAARARLEDLRALRASALDVVALTRATEEERA